MKDQLSVIITAAALAFVAVRVYQKYFKKGIRKEGMSGDSKKGSAFPESHGGDDYEPYSKK